MILAYHPRPHPLAPARRAGARQRTCPTQPNPTHCNTNNLRPRPLCDNVIQYVARTIESFSAVSVSRYLRET